MGVPNPAKNAKKIDLTPELCKVRVMLLDRAGHIVGSDVSDAYFTTQPLIV